MGSGSGLPSPALMSDGQSECVLVPSDDWRPGAGLGDGNPSAEKVAAASDRGSSGSGTGRSSTNGVRMNGLVGKNSTSTFCPVHGDSVRLSGSALNAQDVTPSSADACLVGSSAAAAPISAAPPYFSSE